MEGSKAGYAQIILIERKKRKTREVSKMESRPRGSQKDTVQPVSSDLMASDHFAYLSGAYLNFEWHSAEQ